MRAGLPQARKAFTLVELLVVVAVLALLAALLLPALASAKSRAGAVSCLANEKQLSLACMLYAIDFNDRFPYNLGSAEIRQNFQQGRAPNWTTPVMNWELDSDNTNSTLLVGAGLGPYVGRSAAVYACPSDRVVSDVQTAAGWSRRVRSISMNMMIGDAGEFSQSGANTNNPEYAQFFRTTQVPSPSRIFVFIEEHPDSINDGYFLNKPESYKWMDLPASWHHGAANVSFADGHLETHKWLFPSTKPPGRPDAAHLPRSIPKRQLGDFMWLMDRMSVEASYGYADLPSPW